VGGEQLQDRDLRWREDAGRYVVFAMEHAPELGLADQGQSEGPSPAAPPQSAACLVVDNAVFADCANGLFA
jgi:hypothetical protein